jgi:hypothetical protein
MKRWNCDSHSRPGLHVRPSLLSPEETKRLWMEDFKEEAT